MQKGSDKPKMFLVIEGWKKSGLSQMEDCKEQGIRYHVFHYWYKVYRDEQQASANPPSSFIELQVQAEDTTIATTTATNVELVLPNGKRLLFHGSVEASFLCSLLQ